MSPIKRMDSVVGLALLVTGRVPWEPELLDPWKAAWDRLIWKALIPKVKAIEGELNRNLRHLWRGDLRSNLYSSTDLEGLPIVAALASRGCGNPTALAELHVGEKVLDLGCGGGIDVLLSARRVGPTGFAYGLDMTDAMLDLAERNRAEAQIENVEFLQGIIEAIPLPDQSVDVVISNCVINLSADKSQVVREAYRVLTPRGRFAVSDIVIQGRIPQIIQKDMEAWAGCIAGALEEETYQRLLAEAGFTAIEIEVTRRYGPQEIAESGASTSIAALSQAERTELDGKFVSAFIRARKPF